ncbi:hypothetical protein O0L34_g11532 [Tuta absoluta]|nr:hypothetical protein O0L34_g11532 [Tuta absoluta]
MEVMTNESGRPTNRFSLRLSSQLMRGLVRLYERKATVLLGELCMINATVFKSTNKKLVGHDVHERPLRRLPAPPAAPAAAEKLDEHRVEELLQNSGNVVSNIQDITLKEAAIPDFQLPPNDNFGEENPNQALQSLLADRTLELMLHDTNQPAQISGLDLPCDKSGDKSADKSRVTLEVPQMESIAELDVTLFRKSGAADIPIFEKDVPEVPEVPEVPLPEPPAPTLPIPIPEIRIDQPEEIPIPPPEPEIQKQPDVLQEQEVLLERVTREQPPERRESVIEELEELESQPRAARKRRARPHLIIDKRIKLTSDYVRARIDNPLVEMRFEDFTDAIIPIRVPWDILLHRPASEGWRVHSRVSPLLGRLYQRNLGVAHSVPYADRVVSDLTAAFPGTDTYLSVPAIGKTVLKESDCGTRRSLC